MAIAIGDIHGCLGLLENLVEELPRDEELVFLGDYVDRGPQSAQVIAYLQNLASERTCHFLMGNHENMMANAIGDESGVAVWLFNGGEATLNSYGLNAQEWIHHEDRGALLPGFLDFLAILKPYHEDDSAIFVHAGIDRSIPDMARQDAQVLMWTREGFIRSKQPWSGKPVIFGHTPTMTLGVELGQIYFGDSMVGIDTGGVFGGALSGYNPVTRQVYQAFSDRPAWNRVGMSG